MNATNSDSDAVGIVSGSGARVQDAFADSKTAAHPGGPGAHTLSHRGVEGVRRLPDRGGRIS